VTVTNNVVSFREHERRRLLSSPLDLEDPETQYRLFLVMLQEWFGLKPAPFKVTVFVFGMSIFDGLESAALSAVDIAARCGMTERRVRRLLGELEASNVITIERDSAVRGVSILRVNLTWRDPARAPFRAEVR